jgi:[protein-PII] uridylyltransferase
LKNGLAFDTYEVTNPPDAYHETESWAKTKTDFQHALDNLLSLDRLIQEKRDAKMRAAYGRQVRKKVVVNNEKSDFFTLIEIRSSARLGLLYDLACVIFAMDLDIRTAKVNSDGEKMTGVFYVRDSGGEKIYEPDVIEEAKGRLMGVL